MLIVEGADLVGKTTLCNELLTELNRRRLGYVYRHLTKLPDGWNAPWSYQSLMAERSVQDRFHMSEIVYARTRGDEPLLSPVKYDMVDAWLRLACGLTVVLVAKRTLIERRYEQRAKDEMYSLDQILAVNEAFHSIVDNRSLCVGTMVYRPAWDLYEYVTEDHSPDARLIVDAYVRRREEMQMTYKRRHA